MQSVSAFSEEQLKKKVNSVGRQYKIAEQRHHCTLLSAHGLAQGTYELHQSRYGDENVDGSAS